jgi:hypothetical protein
MPWRECSVMEERLRFVARLLEGEGMSQVCRGVRDIEEDRLQDIQPLPGMKDWRRFAIALGRLPSGDIVREIKPVTIPRPDLKTLDPETLDLRAHYWAAKGF